MAPGRASVGLFRYTRPTLRVGTAVFLTTILISTLLAPPGARATDGERAVVVFTGPTMGTRYTVRVVAPPLDDDGREAIRAAIDGQLELTNRLLSTWDPESEISRFNRHSSTEPFALSAETLGLLEIARRVGELSNGAFEVTVGPLVEAWGFGPAGPPSRTPSPESLAELRARVGPDQLVVAADGASVVKARTDVSCDLSALAPGWAADRIAAALKALGHHDFIVDIGGEVVARGRRIDGARWRVAVESPGRDRDHLLVLALEDVAVATSGDYRNVYVDESGRRRSHLIDPRTGEPVTHELTSVTVVHQEGVWADALATALLVMGPEPAWMLATREGLAIRLVARVEGGTYSAVTTPEFEALVWAGP
jgi:thiamine biosynthesis lipoprotein